MKRLIRKAPLLISSALIYLLVCGCSVEVDGWKVREAEEVCKEHGGLETLYLPFGSRSRCADGILIELSKANQ